MEAKLKTCHSADMCYVQGSCCIQVEKIRDEKLQQSTAKNSTSASMCGHCSLWKKQHNEGTGHRLYSTDSKAQ
jgi:hypothetical protein